MTDKCAACGSLYSEGAAYCAVCGQPLGGVAPAPPMPGTNASAPAVGPPIAAPPGGIPVVSAPPVGPGTPIGAPPAVGFAAESEVCSDTQLSAWPQGGTEGSEAAPLGRRFLAVLFDFAVIGVVLLALWLVGRAADFPTTIVSAGCAVGYWLFIAWWEGRTGKTIGNLAMGVVTLDIDRLTPIGFGRALVRWVIVGAGAIALGVGQFVIALSAGFDSSPRRQGWHDKATKAGVFRRQPAASMLAPVAKISGPDGRVRPGAIAGVPTSASGPRGYGQPGAAPDPWTFPSAAAARGVRGGLITGAPGISRSVDDTDDGPVTAQHPVVSPGSAPVPGAPAVPLAPAGSGASAKSAAPVSQPVAPAPAVPAVPLVPAPAKSAAPASQPVTPAPGAVKPTEPPTSTAKVPIVAEPPLASAAFVPPIVAASPASAPAPITGIPVVAPPVKSSAVGGSAPTAAATATPLTPPPTAGPQVPVVAAPAAVPTPAAAPSVVEVKVPAVEPAGPFPAEESQESTRFPTEGRQPPRLESAPVVPVLVELESGERRLISRPTLVGRNPQTPDGSDWELLPLADPGHSVSKTHLELGIDPGGLWVRDRGSTNGTIVSVPGSPPRLVDITDHVRVPVGATIHVGDCRLVVVGTR